MVPHLANGNLVIHATPLARPSRDQAQHDCLQFNEERCPTPATSLINPEGDELGKTCSRDSSLFVRASPAVYHQESISSFTSFDVEE